MGKNTMAYFSKIYLAMGIITAAMVASEDGKITGAEMVGIVNMALMGMGVSGLDLKGIALVPAPDGGVNLYFPPAVVDKLHINV
jgi:hypothetical protein